MYGRREAEGGRAGRGSSLSALVQYVHALRGRLEVRAVFGTEAIVIRRERDEQRSRKADGGG